MTPDEIAKLFTRTDGTFLFARWERPLVPVVFGVDEATLPIIKGACEAMVGLANHSMAETDPELGANFMIFFVRDWAELRDVPDLHRLIPNMTELLDRLNSEKANQYRVFRFEPSGAIRACFSFVVLDANLESVAAEVLALNQILQAILLWSDNAFVEQSALVQVNGTTMLRPDLAAVIRAAYDPVLPTYSADPTHCYRLAA
ncbi:MAG: hypothetical protein AAFQ66_22050, partial [Pseudomonadota bacterium]